MAVGRGGGGLYERGGTCEGQCIVVAVGRGGGVYTDAGDIWGVMYRCGCWKAGGGVYGCGDV